MVETSIRSSLKPSLAAGKVPKLIKLLTASGIDGSRLVEACGVPLSLAADPDARVSLEAWARLNHRAAKELEDPDFGLHMGEGLDGIPTLLGSMILSCATVEEALEKHLRYQRLEQEGWEIVQSRSVSCIELSYRPLHPLAVDRLLIDCALSGLLAHYRMMTGQDLHVSEARFAYPAPLNISEHHRIFQSPLLFSSDESRLVILESDIKVPLLRSNTLVRRYLEKPLSQAMAEFTASEPVTQRVIRFLTREMTDKVPRLQNVAKEFGLGSRVLQILLQEEGTSFQKLLDLARKKIAKEYLTDPTVTIQEISFFLGFSEPSAFHRAFRRWTGRTPSEYRNPK